MEEIKISEKLSYWRLAQPVRKRFFSPLQSLILTIALSVSLVLRSALFGNSVHQFLV